MDCVLSLDFVLFFIEKRLLAIPLLAVEELGGEMREGLFLPYATNLIFCTLFLRSTACTRFFYEGLYADDYFIFSRNWEVEHAELQVCFISWSTLAIFWYMSLKSALLRKDWIAYCCNSSGGEKQCIASPLIISCPGNFQLSPNQAISPVIMITHVSNFNQIYEAFVHPFHMLLYSHHPGLAYPERQLHLMPGTPSGIICGGICLR